MLNLTLPQCVHLNNAYSKFLMEMWLLAVSLTACLLLHVKCFTHFPYQPLINSFHQRIPSLRGILRLWIFIWIHFQKTCSVVHSYTIDKTNLCSWNDKVFWTARTSFFMKIVLSMLIHFESSILRSSNVKTVLLSEKFILLDWVVLIEIKIVRSLSEKNN